MKKVNLQEAFNFAHGKIKDLLPGVESLSGYNLVNDFFFEINDFFDKKNEEIEKFVGEIKEKGIIFQKNRLIMMIPEIIQKISQKGEK